MPPININTNEDWRGPGFRNKVTTQIEDALRQTGNPIQKTPQEMENHVFQKAKTREEYMELVARLILHVKEVKGKSTQHAMGANKGQVPMQGGGMDPINALQTLTKQSIPVSGQMNQVPGGMIPGQMTIQPGQAPGQMQQMTGQQIPNQQQHMSTGGMIPRPQYQNFQGGMMQNPRMQMNVPPQMMQRQMAPQGMPGMMQQQQPPQQATHQGMVMNSGPLQPTSQSYWASSRANTLQAILSDTPPSMVPVPSPAGLPMSVGPSPQSNIVSPGSMKAIGSPMMHTPGNPSSAGAPQMAPSPGHLPNRGFAGEDSYMDKWKSLQKYKELLKRMINKLAKDDPNQVPKFKSLLDILEDPNRRTEMSKLEKCEQVLEKLASQFKTSDSEQHICQPLLDVIKQHSQKPSLNHSLHKTFNSCVTALHGPPIKAPSPPPKRRKLDLNNKSIPNVLLGEIARLGNRFHVKHDPMYPKSSQVVHLICEIDDRYLPAVPPLFITVPENYPKSSPSCPIELENYDTTPFLKNVQKLLSSKMLVLPTQCSLTAILNTWEMSIRKATGLIVQ